MRGDPITPSMGERGLARSAEFMPASWARSERIIDAVRC